MEMLYRLSYVGFDDRDVQVGSTAVKPSSVGVLRLDRDDVAQRPGVERRTPPRRLSVPESRRGSVRARKSNSGWRSSQFENIRIWHFMTFGLIGPATRAAPRAARRPDDWSGKRDSNPRPSAWKADALATELFPLNSLQKHRMVVGEGFEPSKASPTDLQSVPFDRSGTPPNPAASSRGPGWALCDLRERKAGEGTRTPNHLITNEMLYQLSYASRARATTSGGSTIVSAPMPVKISGAVAARDGAGSRTAARPERPAIDLESRSSRCSRYQHRARAGIEQKLKRQPLGRNPLAAFSRQCRE